MARVSHKGIHKMLVEERSKVTDRQFFRSRLLAGHFEDIAAAQSRRYNSKHRVRVEVIWEPKSSLTAVTNDRQILINAGFSAVKDQKTRLERYEMVSGLFSHELGHVLFTDFLQAQSYQNFSLGGTWYPAMPIFATGKEQSHLRDIADYWTTPQNCKRFAKMAMELWNILEDGYIEDQMLRRYPGKLGYTLDKLRNYLYEQMPTVSDLEDEEDKPEQIWLSILQLILSYGKYGEIKCGTADGRNPRVIALFRMLDIIDEAVQTTDPRTRFDCINRILVLNWPYVRAFLDAMPEEDESGAGGTIVVVGGSGMGSGDHSAIATGGSPSSTPSPTANKRGHTSNTAKGVLADEKNQESEEDKEGTDEKSSAEASTEPEDADASDKEELDGQLQAQRESGEANKVSDTETGRIPFQQTADVSIPTGGTTEYDSSYTGAGYQDAAKDIERILDNIACEALEQRRTVTMNELANTISYGDIHDGVNKHIHRIASVDADLIEAYHSIAKPLLHISKQLQKSVRQQLQDRRRGGKQTGLYMGRRLDTHAIPRQDGRVFYKSSLPNETPELAVGLLVDESGSMCSKDRITYARAASIILYDFCKSLHIPILIYGHSTGGGVNLYSYAEFDSYKGDDCYRLMDMSSRGSNRDGAALRYVAERLHKRPEELKVLILISDGQPADCGYTGTAAEEDLRGIKHEYKRKGVQLIAAAIGDDKENLERIYGDSFMDISDLNKLPVLLSNRIKQFIRL